MLGRNIKGQPLPVGDSYRLIADLPFDEIEIFTGTLNILCWVTRTKGENP